MYNPFKKRYSAEEQELIDFLSKTRHFEKLNDDEMSNFLPCMYLRKYKQNEVVFFHGDPSHALYLIKNGEVTLSIDVNKSQEELARIGQGAVFGDDAFIDESKRVYDSMITTEQAELYVIPQINLLDILENDLEIKSKVMSSIAELHNAYTKNVFKEYRNNFGFFQLNRVYDKNL